MNLSSEEKALVLAFRQKEALEEKHRKVILAVFKVLPDAPALLIFPDGTYRESYAKKDRRRRTKNKNFLPYVGSTFEYHKRKARKSKKGEATAKMGKYLLKVGQPQQDGLVQIRLCQPGDLPDIVYPSAQAPTLRSA